MENRKTRKSKSQEEVFGITERQRIFTDAFLSCYFQLLLFSFLSPKNLGPRVKLFI